MKNARADSNSATGIVALLSVSDRVNTRTPSFTSYVVTYVPKEVSIFTGSGISSTTTPGGNSNVAVSASACKLNDRLGPQLVRPKLDPLQSRHEHRLEDIEPAAHHLRVAVRRELDVEGPNRFATRSSFGVIFTIRAPGTPAPIRAIDARVVVRAGLALEPRACIDCPASRRSFADPAGDRSVEAELRFSGSIRPVRIRRRHRHAHESAGISGHQQCKAPLQVIRKVADR